MRTVWLALVCVIGLATAAVVKMGMSPGAIADAPAGTVSSASADVLQKTVPSDDANSRSEAETTAMNIQDKASIKADKLEVSYTDGIKAIKSVAIAPTGPEPTPSNRTERILSWHWHDPLDKRTARPSVKRKVSNPRIANARVSKP